MMKKLLLLLALLPTVVLAQVQPTVDSTPATLSNKIINGASNTISAPIQFGGATFATQSAPVGNPCVSLGGGAGAAWNLTTCTLNTAVGWGALNANTSGLENTAEGTEALNTLTTGQFDTGIGEHAGGYITTESSDTFVGNDACRNCFNTSGGNSAFGKSSLLAGAPVSSVAVGFQAMFGNSSAITIGGTATTNDVVSLIFTSTSIAGSPVTVTYTVIGGDTLATIAAGLVTAINANNAITSPSQGSAQLNGASTGLTSTIQMVLTGSCTGSFGGSLSTCITSSVSGAATETVTIGGGITGAENVGIGFQAMSGFQQTTAHDNIGIGKFSLANMTTALNNVAIAPTGGLQALTTGSDNDVMGVNAGLALTTGTQNVCDGSSACAAATTVSDITAVGYQAAKATTNTDVTAIGHGALILDTTSGNGQNTCVGSACGQSVTTAGLLTGVGFDALGSMVSNSSATAMGWKAAVNATGNNVTAFGDRACGAVTSGNQELCLGPQVGNTTVLTGNNDVLIGVSTACVPSGTTAADEINLCTSSTQLMRITGGGTPATSAASFAGTLSATGGLSKISYSGSAPVVSACGTGPAIDANATNFSGTVTVGTVAAASCTVTFASSGFTTFNHCRVTSQSTIASFAYSYTKTVLTVTGTSLVGDAFDYSCDGT